MDSHQNQQGLQPLHISSCNIIGQKGNKLAFNERRKEKQGVNRKLKHSEMLSIRQDQTEQFSKEQYQQTEQTFTVTKQNQSQFNREQLEQNQVISLKDHSQFKVDMPSNQIINLKITTQHYMDGQKTVDCKHPENINQKSACNQLFKKHYYTQELIDLNKATRSLLSSREKRYPLSPILSQKQKLCLNVQKYRSLVSSPSNLRQNVKLFVQAQKIQNPWEKQIYDQAMQLSRAATSHEEKRNQLIRIFDSNQIIGADIQIRHKIGQDLFSRQSPKRRTRSRNKQKEQWEDNLLKIIRNNKQLKKKEL